MGDSGIVDTALLWSALLLAIGAARLVAAVRRYRAGDSALLSLAGVALVIGWITERAEPTGTVPAWLLESVTVAALLFVFGVLGLWLLRRWRAWGDEGADASL